MGLLSSATSITCYRVEGKVAKPVADTVCDGLKKNIIDQIDGKPAEKAVGWTAFGHPYVPKFTAEDFLFGAAMIFSLRIDKKAIPANVIRKYCQLEADRQTGSAGRKALSKNEKKTIKEKVVQDLALRVPATPRVYDLVWHYEQGRLWFFSNLKNANEELETLFLKSFSLRLIRLFPYTIAALESDLSDGDKERLFQTPPSQFH